MKVTWTKEVNPKGIGEHYKSSPFVGAVTTAKVSPAGANAIVQQALARHDHRYGTPETRDALTTDNELKIQTTAIKRNVEGKRHPMEVCITCIHKVDSPNTVYVLSAIMMEPHQNLVMEQVEVVMKEVTREMGILMEQQQPQSRWSDDQLPQPTKNDVSPVGKVIFWTVVVGVVAAFIGGIAATPIPKVDRERIDKATTRSTPAQEPTPSSVEDKSEPVSESPKHLEPEEGRVYWQRNEIVATAPDNSGFVTVPVDDNGDPVKPQPTPELTDREKELHAAWKVVCDYAGAGKDEEFGLALAKYKALEKGQEPEVRRAGRVTSRDIGQSNTTR